ncbi:amidohydrolase family protein [Halomonas sp. V046]|uniref:amidohydrolase family protein n=1 Tax=Halomonas sp. V046 TaxID=3459611 RepID=UPI0040446E61
MSVTATLDARLDARRDARRDAGKEAAPLKVIDPHLHYWSLAEGNQPWLVSPAANLLGDYTAMARDHLPEDLARDSAGVEVLACVHVEADAVDPVAETRWLAEVIGAGSAEQGGRPCAAPGFFPGALVVGADLSRPDAEEQLDRQLALSDRVRGVRQILNVHATPLYDYVGRHFMVEPRWRDNFALLGRKGLSFDLQIYPSQMPEAAKLARTFADTTFIINHAGMYVDRETLDGWRAWRDGLRALASCPNVAIKLSGFGMLDHRWTRDSLRPLIWEAIDAFGVERAMFASNFPVDRLYASYVGLWQAYQDIVAGASASDHAWLFRDTARQLYRL